LISILAISGSLRAASSNTALLRAAARVAPPGVVVRLFNGLGVLPLFNPDNEEPLPEPVKLMRAQVDAADGLLIASPEYAHGVTGAMKNALDWLVSGPEFVYKPVALWNASSRAVHAYASLKETVRTMSARIVEEACITVPLLGRDLDTERIVADVSMAICLRDALEAFAGKIEEFRGGEAG
jgi:chromate reductase